MLIGSNPKKIFTWRKKRQKAKIMFGVGIAASGVLSSEPTLLPGKMHSASEHQASEL